MKQQRKPQATDFHVPVEGIGTFVFGKRTMADELAVQREFADILGGVEPTAWLQTMAGWLAVLRVLTVKAPDGWDLDALDPLEDETYAKLNRVYTALREKEDSFRRGPKPAGEGSGA